MNATQLSRRSFVTIAAGAGAAFVLGFRCVDEKSKPALKASSAKATVKANVWISIDSDGLVTLTVPKPDMGQGARTVLAMILAEELGADWEKIKVVQAPADGTDYGGQGVGGSGTVRGMFKPLMMAGATAAAMIKGAAAKEWNVDASACSLEGGHVVASGKSAPIGDFAAAAALQAAPDSSTLTPKGKAQYRLVGKPTKRVDNRDVVTGAAMFGLDTKIPDKKVAVMVRPRVFGSSVKSFDDTASKAVPGYVATYQIGNSVALVGENTWAAMCAAEALKVTYDDGPNVGVSTATISKAMADAVQPFPDMPTGSAKTISATYELPYLSHATMEPQNCTAHVTADRCEVWVPTQQPEGARRTAAQVSGVPAENTLVHVTLVGGGFGRRLSVDYVQECVAIAKQLGKPVQLVWTRTDDLQHDQYRMATLQAMKGAVDAQGNPIASYHQLIESAGGRRNRNGEAATAPSWNDGGSPYQIETKKRLRNSIGAPIPTGAWRSVENTYQQFAIECFFDELCTAGGKDPVEARLKLLGDERLKATLTRAAELADWGKPLPPKVGRGVACFSGYGSVITQIAEVDCSGKKPKVKRMTAVVDCGLAVNPLGVEAQVQGAMMDAISTTLHAAITIQGGGVAEVNFDGFKWGRMEDCPHMTVEIMPGGDTPQGMGEVGYPASGPAIANAIFAATGKRVRKLPVKMEELV